MVSFYFPSEPRAFKGCILKPSLCNCLRPELFKMLLIPLIYTAPGIFRHQHKQGDWTFPDGERRIHWWEDAAWTHPCPAGMGQMGTGVQMPQFTDVGHGEKPRKSLLPSPKATLGPSIHQNEQLPAAGFRFKEDAKAIRPGIHKSPFIMPLQANKLLLTAQSLLQMCASSLWRLGILCWSSSGTGQGVSVPKLAKQQGLLQLSWTGGGIELWRHSKIL